MRLKDRVAIVTGGGIGIGRAYALGLAREGANVVIGDITADGGAQTAAEIVATGARAVSVKTDVADQESTELLARTALSEFGQIDILVNNAALFTAIPLRDWDDIPVEEWDRVMAVNLKGPYLCARAVAPAMKQRRYGKIINISSASISLGNPKRVHYVTSKAGIVGFTRSLARALGEWNICVNSILPGSTASEGAMEAYGGGYFERPPANRPIQRIEQPEDLVGTVIFLSSADSDFISGQSLIVDGGVVMSS